MYVPASLGRPAPGRRIRFAVSLGTDGCLDPRICIPRLADSRDPRRPHEGDEQEVHLLLKWFDTDVPSRGLKAAAFLLYR